LATCKALFARHTMHSYYDILFRLRGVELVVNIDVSIHQWFISRMKLWNSHDTLRNVYRLSQGGMMVL
jgi:hypothetical protein